RIAFEQRGVSFSFGWLQAIVVEESPVFVPGSRLDLARTTVILGNNASGKTALCELLAGCSEISFLKRWSPLGKRGARTQVRFEAVSPLPFNWTVRVYQQSNIQFAVNGLPVPRLIVPYTFVHAPERPFRRKADDETISAYIARWLRVDVALVHNVVRSLAARGGHHVHNPRFVEAEGREELRLDVDGTVAGLDFQSLSDTEQCRVIIEMALELARFEAQQGPTVLLVDCTGRFDRSHFQDYVEFIASSSADFQSVVTAPYADALPMQLRIDGLHVARLRGSVTNVEICQTA
ncbi:MAG: hypothetical protein AB7K63_12240, partial [Vicinamibacterales bacterium]